MCRSIMYRASQFSLLFLFFSNNFPCHYFKDTFRGAKQNEFIQLLLLEYLLFSSIFFEIEKSDIMEKHHTKVVGKVFCGLFMKLVFHTN